VEPGDNGRPSDSLVPGLSSTRLAGEEAASRLPGPEISSSVLVDDLAPNVRARVCRGTFGSLQGEGSAYPTLHQDGPDPFRKPVFSITPLKRDHPSALPAQGTEP
jgi:hypothetical protein